MMKYRRKPTFECYKTIFSFDFLASNQAVDWVYKEKSGKSSVQGMKKINKGLEDNC